MELNELFKKFSLETIEDKTNIPKEKLEDLKNKEWTKFKRAQALGFLNILEREFSIDLDTEKSECKSFFAEQEPHHTSASIDFVESQVASSSNGGVVSKAIAAVTILALGYAGWYYYNKQSETYSQPTSLELNSSNEESNNTQNSISEENSQNSTNSDSENKEKVVNKVSSNSSNNQENKQEEQTDKSAQESNQKFNLSTQDSNLNNNETNIANTTKEKSVKAEVDSLLDEANKSTKEQNSTIANENNTTTATQNEQNSTALNTDENNTTLNANLNQDNNTTNQEAKLPDKIRITVHSKKLWLGIYNVDTGKKVNKIIRRGTTLDLTNGKLAIITGHGHFSLVADNETKKFRKRGKVYLLVSKEDGIKELTRREYKELTKRKAY